MAKGGEFEREICYELSKWWSGKDDEDDIFWRSSQSGGRATTRGRKGKRTSGHCGDIAATHPSGNLFIEVLTVEMKRGYNSATLADLMDKPPHPTAQQIYEKWYQQATEAMARAKSYSWMIIHRRDKRKHTVTMPWGLVEELRSVGSFKSPMPFLAVSAAMRLKNEDGTCREILAKLACVTWKYWLASVTPAHIKQIWKRF